MVETKPHGNTRYIGCSIDECIESHYCRSYCKRHYNQNVNKHRSGNMPSEYTIWLGMRARCYRKTNPKYPAYGGRGIEMCDQWRNDFKAFLSYMGKRPTSEHSIDRIDNDGDYEPGNVRWATAKMQANNRKRRI